MKNTEFEEKLYPSDLGMSPSFALARFDSILKKYGKNTVLTESRFKKAREVWVSAAFLLGLSEMRKQDHWVIPEHKMETPDTYGVSFIPHPKRKDARNQEIINIEVTEWGEHSSKNLVEDIKKKLANKKYPNYFTLLIYARKPGLALDLEVIYNALAEIDKSSGIGQILLIASVMNVKPDMYVIIGLFPTRIHFEFSLRELREKYKFQGDMIKTSRGVGDIFLIDKQYSLPLPNLRN